jgi:DNA-binding response OmpR family regulator
VALRVLVVQRRFDVDGVEQEVAPDGEAAFALLGREAFDAVWLDLSLAPLDGWFLLAAIGSWARRPRLIARLGAHDDVERAQALGADICVLAGTSLNARALEAACRQPRANNFPSPTTSGVPA